MENIEITALTNVIWDRLKNRINKVSKNDNKFKEFENEYKKIYYKIVPLKNQLDDLYSQIKMLANEFSLVYARNKDLATYKKDYRDNEKYGVYRDKNVLTKEQIRDFVIVSSMEESVKLETLIENLIKTYNL